MKVHVKYFASIREAFGCSAQVVDTDANTLAALRDFLVARGGAGGEALSRGRLVRMALNQVMSDETAQLLEDCEVAVFPPVTGG
jgi:molybdopterin synthase sulfur carrier subunit